jgi:hypothetical protein
MTGNTAREIYYTLFSVFDPRYPRIFGDKAADG